jgi:AcrR family transcriptional regulator
MIPKTPARDDPRRSDGRIRTRNGLSGSRDIERDRGPAPGSQQAYVLLLHIADKEGLYVAVLEEAYRKIREIEAGLRPSSDCGPSKRARSFVGFTFDLSERGGGNEDFIRSWWMIENIHHGRYLDKSQIIQKLNVTAIDAVKRLYTRGVEEGLFRKGLDPIDIHWAISALCFFNVSNRATFSRIFKRDMASASALATRRRHAIDMIVRYLAR